MTPRTSAEYWLNAAHAPQQCDERGKVTATPSEEMRRAAALLEQAVRDIRPWSQWKASLALANCYKSGQDNVGWHSDFLSTLGPRPIIVGLSLGAKRLFRLRHCTTSRVVTMPMPHNSAVIMWDDCQEEWHHSVPKQADSSVGRHAVAGLTRISLTYRMARPDFSEQLGKCHCGRQGVLKSKNGRYYVGCCPAGAKKQCGFWQPCAWAQQEAERLRSELQSHAKEAADEAAAQKKQQPDEASSTISFQAPAVVLTATIRQRQQEESGGQNEAAELGTASGTLERPVIDIT
eukprot:TRINITY_DN21257_c0_g1_i2.p1 TRINITY_DN21257_c0_g1~~TRINITY_DN21257_c0_g1_i2.p1  ORF type:complete len:290 (-),score=67.85 TRINITY_DN21257_c0_g1_i2:740-1609(-)